MKGYVNSEILKKHYKNLPSQIELAAESKGRVNMQYLVEQYDRENEFLNRQIRELLDENKKLKKKNYEHIRTDYYDRELLIGKSRNI